jgi:DNA-binding NarL/FixJ family response regulator
MTEGQVQGNDGSRFGAEARTMTLRGSKKRVRLTKRELEVLHLFAEGLGSRAIAQRLSISYTTARNYAQHILDKLGVHSRLAAVARAYAEGLLSRPARE